MPCFTQGKKNPPISLIGGTSSLYCAVECTLLWECREISALRWGVGPLVYSGRKTRETVVPLMWGTLRIWNVMRLSFCHICAGPRSARNLQRHIYQKDL